MIQLTHNGVTISVTPQDIDWYLNAGYERVEEAKPQASESALSDMTLAELRSEAKGRGLSGYSNMAKDDLIAFLEKEGE